MGPYLSIRPLESQIGNRRAWYLVEEVSRETRRLQGLPYVDLDQVRRTWGDLEGFLQKERIRGVIRSTSDDVQGANVETLASVAAQRAGVPVFVVEDFPGNYQPVVGERLDGLFVEHESMVDHHCARGVARCSIHNTGNPRYAKLIDVDSGNRRLRIRQDLGLSSNRVVLWAGQPDGDNSYLALQRLLANFDEAEVTLLFRAHPRDAAYKHGRYADLSQMTSMEVVDVSSFPDPIGIYCSADLVATQFSSAGVEASYLGTPALFVLFEELGKQYLQERKGYSVPPWCFDGCTFLIQEEDEIPRVLSEALFDAPSRSRVRSNFQDRFAGRTDSADAIGRHITGVLGMVYKSCAPQGGPQSLIA